MPEDGDRSFRVQQLGYRAQKGPEDMDRSFRV